MLGRDFPQAVMRVLLAGASEAGFHGAMLATGLEVSLARCPWSGAVWWQAIVNGAKEFLKMAGPNDAIFRALAPGMRLRSPFWRSALLDKRLAVMFLRSIINISF